jgi:hypothetical protein
MNIFTQFDKKFLKNVVGIYMSDQDSFLKDNPQIIEKKRMTTTQGDWDNDYTNWMCVIEDLEGGDRGVALVYKKPDEDWKF